MKKMALVTEVTEMRDGLKVCESEIRIENGITISDHSKTDNTVVTSKYTWYNFFFLCLYEQLKKPANIYFIYIGALQSIRLVSTTGGLPVILFPLMFVISVSMIKCAWEDYKRHQNDKEENERMFFKMKTTDVLSKKAVLEQLPSHAIRVGDLILVSDGQPFPADMIPINVAPNFESETPQYCHIETSNIDGETNLKLRFIPECISGESLFTFKQFGESRISIAKASDFTNSDHDDGWSEVDMTLTVSAPKGCLDKFTGSEMRVDNKNMEPSQLSLDNLIPRGAQLQNNAHIIGVVVYTGTNCKVYKNGADSRSKIKHSFFENATYKMVGLAIFIQIILCITMSIAYFFWSSTNSNLWYLQLNVDDISTQSFYKFFKYSILFSQIIPISLMVCLEFARFFQGKIMESDKSMCQDFKIGDQIRTRHCNVQTSELNEDLGLVQFVFSDKTGTLTENVLDFRQLKIAGNPKLGGGYTQIAWMNMKRRGGLPEADEITELMMEEFHITEKEARHYQISASKEGKDAFEICKEDHDMSDFKHVNFNHISQLSLHESLINSIETNDFDKILPFDTDGGKPLSPYDKPEVQNELFLRSLAFNSDCFPVENEDKIQYNADNPDDVCFAWFCKYAGFELCPYMKPFKELKIQLPGQEVRYEKWRQLEILKFCSAKQRMSVVMQPAVDGDDRIFVFIKGADSMIKSLSDPKSVEYFTSEMETDLDTFCEEGLRTLLVGYAVYTKKWWEENWAKRFSQNLEEDERLELEEEFDRSVQYQICGITAVEDKLQKRVPETISNLLAANIRTWILTGDKKGTAINIGFACNLLTPEMEKARTLTQIDGSNYKKVLNEVTINQNNEENEVPSGLVVTGEAIGHIFSGKNPQLQEKFIEFALNCHSVVACRLQPSQKANIVEAIKKRTGAVTLAIGDGANDEPMIRCANVGVGIAGLEGTAAARASDYAIAKFQHLNQLLFVHGRNAYSSVSILVFYLMYKNCLQCLNFFWFAFFNGFSGQPLFQEYMWQGWNMAFTAFPVFVLALVDVDISKDLLLRFPGIYTKTNGFLEIIMPGKHEKISICKRFMSLFTFKAGNEFKSSTFLRWFIEAFFQSCFFTFTIFSIFEETTSFEKSGKTWGFMELSMLFYTTTFIFVNYIIFREYTQISFWHISFALFTIAVYAFASIFVNFSSTFSSQAGIDLKGTILYTQAFSSYWVILILMTISPILFMEFVRLIENIFFPTALSSYQKHSQKIDKRCFQCFS